MASEDTESRNPLKRAATMQVTAEEGLAHLDKEGTTLEETADHLRSGNLFKSPEADNDNDTDVETKRARMQRAGTMAVTAEEGKAFLERFGGVADSTVSNSDEPDAGEGDDDIKEKRARLQRAGTMAVTAQEGVALLEQEGSTLEDTADHLRSGKDFKSPAKDEADSTGNVDGEETKDKRARLQRVGTMAQTAQEAKEYLKDDEFLLKNISRAQQESSPHTKQDEPDSGSAEKDEDVEKRRSSLQRTQTMAATVEDAKEILGDDELGKTRSQDPELDEGSLKRTHTMAETIEEGEELLKRKKI